MDIEEAARKARSTNLWGAPGDAYNSKESELNKDRFLKILEANRQYALGDSNLNSSDLVFTIDFGDDEIYKARSIFSREYSEEKNFRTPKVEDFKELNLSKPDDKSSTSFNIAVSKNKKLKTIMEKVLADLDNDGDVHSELPKPAPSGPFGNSPPRKELREMHLAPKFLV